ncbi:hypothetical protein HMPREF9004_0140 [Schaalia cardiffensis F0333]|uniref:Uncharacterized protein n=1 Tax=Schaalia cardiffensis F0333 TaxID=888050 RepID=N6X6E1_9ACTO|nr:hypothetical protein HMPREF9004_0140 [Schaalia cardiffensis F0333]
MSGNAEQQKNARPGLSKRQGWGLRTFLLVPATNPDSSFSQKIENASPGKRAESV